MTLLIREGDAGSRSHPDDFSATNQGRSLGVRAIVAINDTDFLVLERDNRGLGIEVTPTPWHKRVYRLSLHGATDGPHLSLANSDDLPPGVLPVSKTPCIDVLGQLMTAGQTVPEKREGLALGPHLADGSDAMLPGTDNDYSVTQTGAGQPLDVCVDATGTRREQGPIDQGCPSELALIPGFLMSFQGTVEAYQPSQHVHEKDDDFDDNHAEDRPRLPRSRRMPSHVKIASTSTWDALRRGLFGANDMRRYIGGRRGI